MQQWRSAIGGFRTWGCKRVRKKRQKRGAALLSNAPLWRQMVMFFILTSAPLQSREQNLANELVTHVDSNPIGISVKEPPVSSALTSFHDLTNKTGSLQDQFKIFAERKTKTNVRIASELFPKREHAIHFQVKAKCRLCYDIESPPGPCCNA